MPAPLVEVLVDHDAVDQAETGGELAAPLPRGHALAPEGDHVRAHDAGSGRRPPDDGAALVGLVDGPAQCRARDPLSQLELVASGEEDPGGITQQHRGREAVGVPTARRPDRADAGGTQTREDRGVDLDHLRLDRRRGRQDDDAGGVTSRESHEAPQHIEATQLVLRASDHHEGSRCAGGGQGGRRRHPHTVVGGGSPGATPCGDERPATPRAHPPRQGREGRRRR